MSSTSFELVLQCYRSGQVTEQQFQLHLQDELFAAWFKKRMTSGYLPG